MKTNPTGVEFFLFLANNDALQSFRQLRTAEGRHGSISQDLKDGPEDAVISAFLWQGRINPLYWDRISTNWKKHIHGA